MTADPTIAAAIARRPGFEWRVGMLARAVAAGFTHGIVALRSRVNRAFLDDVEAGENPWYPWRIGGPIWPDYTDDQTAALLDDVTPGWRELLPVPPPPDAG